MEEFLPRIDMSDPLSASLGVVEFHKLNFFPKRIYWIHNFVKGTTRGNHAHKELRQIFIMIQGTLKLELRDGKTSKTLNLSSDSGYIFIGPGLWRIISDASADAVLLVLADRPYEEGDYIRQWEQFLAWRNELD